MEAAWQFCPLCGTAAGSKTLAAQEAAETTAEAQEMAGTTTAQKAPMKGAFTGLLFAMITAPILAIVGTMLCLTGLGAFLGVPLIILAIFSPLLGPMIGIGALHGNCPWCGARIHSVIRVPEFFCHACSKRVVVENRKFARGD